MFRHLRPVWAEVDLDKLAHNMREIKRVSKSKGITAVVKADAYGHGAIDIAPVLIDNGADRLAVAVISEAVELRRSGVEIPIMILGFTPPNLIDTLLRYDIEQTVINYEFAKELSNMAKKKNKIAKIHIGMDTGMGRIGFLPNEKSIEDIFNISKLPNIKIQGIFSHFSSADEMCKDYTKEQLNQFNMFYDKLLTLGINIENKHISNSAAIIDLPEAHFDSIRPGIILYGYYPSDEVIKDKLNLRPIMSLKSNIVHLKKLPKGKHVSYGRKFTTKRDSIIATLPVGYADGYTRLLFNKAKVIINGKFAPVVGTICMDQCMVDVTDIEGVKVGNEVILIGEDNHGNKFNADDIANLLGTINYEIVCAINKRVPRVYIKGGKVIKVRNYV